MNQTKTTIETKSKAQYFNLLRFFKLQGYNYTRAAVIDNQATLVNDNDVVIIRKI